MKLVIKTNKFGDILDAIKNSCDACGCGEVELHQVLFENLNLYDYDYYTFKEECIKMQKLGLINISVQNELVSIWDSDVPYSYYNEYQKHQTYYLSL